MKKIMIINGPNLNLLGIREKNLYGDTSYLELKKLIKHWSKTNHIKCDIYQTNYEGKIIDLIQKCFFSHYNGIIINAGGYTHTSIAIMDSLKILNIPIIEVHVSNINSREDFRKKSYISLVSNKSIVGKGVQGYILALEELKNLI